MNLKLAWLWIASTLWLLGNLESLSAAEPEGREAIAKRLDQVVAMDAKDVPLVDALASLSKQSGVSIRIDEKDLREIGVDPQVKVSLRLKGVRLRSMLAHLLRPLDLRFQIRPEGIYVVSISGPDTPEVARVYRIDDILEPWPGPPPMYDCDVVLNAVATAVPEVFGSGWSGPAPGDGFRNTVVYRMPEEVHDRIGEFLELLRGAKRSYRKWNGRDRPIPDLPPDAAWHPRDPLDGAWRKARRQPISLAFEKQPLSEVARVLSEKTGLPFVVDQAELKDVGIEPGSLRITYSCDRLPLESALREMLREHQLAAELWNETLRITTREEADHKPTWVFPVFDLVADDGATTTDGFGQMVSPEDDLLQAIRQGARLGGWEEMGGLDYLSGVGVLVVTGKLEALEEVADFLAQLRKVTSVPPKGNRAKAEAEWVTRTYALPAGQEGKKEKPEEIAKAIQLMAEPESWEKPGTQAKIAVLSDRLVIRQRVGVHGKIQAALWSLHAPLGGGFQGSAAPIPPKPDRPPATDERFEAAPPVKEKGAKP